MIYHRGKLIEWAEDGGIYPYVQEHVNPASIDLCLGNEFVNLETGVRFVAPEILINPGQAILATTCEYIKMPIDAAGVLYLKSSLARQGLDHALAGWIDPGFHGELTLELHAHRPITLAHGQRVLQIVLMEMTGEAQYEGHYLNQKGPTISFKKRSSTMTKKPVVQVTKPASSLCNGQVNRAARAAMEAKIARIKQTVDVVVELAEAESEGEGE